VATTTEVVSTCASLQMQVSTNTNSDIAVPATSVSDWPRTNTTAYVSITELLSDCSLFYYNKVFKPISTFNQQRKFLNFLISSNYELKVVVATLVE